MICGVDVKRDESPYDLVKTLARATDWLRGAEQRHAEGAEAEAPHVELAIESE